MSQRTACSARRDGDGGGVRAAAAQRRQPAAAGHALEACDHRYGPAVQALAQGVGGDVLDPRGAVSVVGEDRHLPAHPRARVQPVVAQHPGQQAGCHLLCQTPPPRRTRRRWRRGPRRRGPAASVPGHQLVGLARHGRDHHRDRMAAPSLPRPPGGRRGGMRSRSASEVPPNFITRTRTRHRRPMPSSAPLAGAWNGGAILWGDARP